MNKFLIDTYSGMQGNRTATKSFSAYDGSSGINRNLNSTLSERDQAVETARKIREKMKKESEQKEPKKSLMEMAKEAKERSSESHQKDDVKQQIENTKQQQEKILDTPQNPTDEELKKNINAMKELNEKMKDKQIGGSPDEVLNSVLSDLF